MLSVESLSLSLRFEASLPFVDELGFMVSAMSDRPSADFIDQPDDFFSGDLSLSMRISGISRDETRPVWK